MAIESWGTDTAPGGYVGAADANNEILGQLLLLLWQGWIWISSSWWCWWRSWIIGGGGATVWCSAGGGSGYVNTDLLTNNPKTIAGNETFASPSGVLRQDTRVMELAKYPGDLIENNRRIRCAPNP